MDIKNELIKYLGQCCGNSFVIYDCREENIDKDLKIHISKKDISKYKTDSALFLVSSNDANVKMEIFEKDGSESDACGNGAMLIGHTLGLFNGFIEMKNITIKTLGDNIEQSIFINLDFSDVDILSEKDKVFFVKVGGEPHVVKIIDKDINDVDLKYYGEKYQSLYKNGVNFNLVKKTDKFHFLIRTYERGVYNETKSCGTGSISSYMAICYFYDMMYTEPVEFKSSGGVHWISRDNDMLKLKTLKVFCTFSKI